jgi:hypothetical protein
MVIDNVSSAQWLLLSFEKPRPCRCLDKRLQQCRCAAEGMTLPVQERLRRLHEAERAVLKQEHYAMALQKRKAEIVAESEALKHCECKHTKDERLHSQHVWKLERESAQLDISRQRAEVLLPSHAFVLSYPFTLALALCYASALQIVKVPAASTHRCRSA